jgi:hypothetical protein
MKISKRKNVSEHSSEKQRTTRKTLREEIPERCYDLVWAVAVVVFGTLGIAYLTN